ncbi:hypothetical protein EYC80_006988 [Monilinia laxa]|uniref:Uncharacterized protein n=1 Tax=Monilinia laxa TaxID=61186 RepID=A0A5N6JZT4_MONLA|nr:hypothetical protein EYC80_006988 [Monilinia laxa]
MGQDGKHRMWLWWMEWGVEGMIQRYICGVKSQVFLFCAINLFPVVFCFSSAFAYSACFWGFYFFANKALLHDNMSGGND